MRPRWEKVLSDLFNRRARSLLVIASIAVGLLAIGVLSIVYNVLSEDMRSGYRAIRPANIQVEAPAIEQDFIESVERLPGVADAAGARAVRLQVRAADGDWKPLSISAYSGKELRAQRINRVQLLDGRWPPNERQIVLDVNKLQELGRQLGDVVEIKLPSGTIRRLPLVGIVRDQMIGVGSIEGGFFLAPQQGYITVETLAWLGEPDSFNTLYVTVERGEEDEAEIRRVADRVLTEFDEKGPTVTSSLIRTSSEHPNVSYVDAVIAVFSLLVLLVVFLSGFLITNTLSALLNQQVTQIGIMKTLGGTRGQIVGLYMAVILAFSLIALAVSIPLSQYMAYALLRYLATQINFTLQPEGPVPAAIVLQAVVALLVPQAAGSLPILQGTRISVRDALDGNTRMALEDHGVVYRLLTRVHGLSRPLMISLRNTFRRRARLLLTLTTLSLGGAIFIATLNVRTSVQSYLDRLTHYFLADVNVTLGQPYRLKRVASDLLDVPGVRSVEGWAGVAAQVVQPDGRPGESVQIIGPPAASPLVEPMLLKGRWILPNDHATIVLCELFLKDRPDLHVGDTIRLKIGTEEKDWLVAGFFQFAGRSGGLMAYTDYDYLAQELGIYGHATYFRVVAEDPELSLAQQEVLGRRVETRLVAAGYDIREITAGHSLQHDVSQGLNVLTTTLLIASLLLAAVGGIGLAGTMGLNVMERTREIGVMRAVGATDGAIMSIVLIEGCLTGLVSWVAACGVAFPISRVLADAIFQILYDRPADMVYTATGNAVWLGVVLVLSIVASVMPAYNASRLTIREVLAFE